MFERVANGVDVGTFGDAEKRTGDGGEEMGVLVAVEVRDADAGALEFFYLGQGFALDVCFVDAAAEQGLDEVDKGWTEGFAVGAKERGDGFWCGGRRTVGKDDVATYT